MSVRALLANIFTGQKPIEYDLHTTPRIVLINIVFAIIFTYCYPFSLVTYLQGEKLIALVDFIVASACTGLFIYCRKTGRYEIGGLAALTLVEALFLFLFWSGGVGTTGALWAYSLPIAALFVLGAKGGTILTFSYMTATFAMYLLGNQTFQDLYSINFRVRYSATYTVVYVIALLVESVRAKAQKKIVEQNTELEKALVRLESTGLSLQESEEKYRTLFEQATDGIAIIQDGKLQFTNPYLEELLGLASNKLIGVEYATFVHPDSQKEVAGNYEKRMTGKEAPGVYSASLVSSDGTPIPVEVRGSITTYEGKKADLVFIRDARERIATEKEKARLQSQLQQVQKMEAVGQLAGGIAHDFNNMLGAISGYADMILKNFGNTSPKLERYSTMILNAAQRAADLTAKLLAFARKGKYEIGAIDIHEIINETVKILEHTVDKRISLVQELNASRHCTDGDSTQLQNAVLNLAVNARDAMPVGGTMRFATEEVSISSDEAAAYPFEVEAGDYIRLIVSDTGVGMDETTRGRIFEPFFTTKELGQGTGLGMASVYGTVKAHRGFVSIQSEIGAGTSIEVFLPVSASAPVIKERRDDRFHIAATGRGTILVIDDEETIRCISTDILEDVGYTVVTANDGIEGIDYYEKHWKDIDLVILDLVMPNIGGYQCFLELKKINPTIRTLVSSGYALNDEARKTLDAGAKAFIQKPFGVKDLSVAVEKALKDT